jgi:carboxymethylenebutenolidase
VTATAETAVIDGLTTLTGATGDLAVLAWQRAPAAAGSPAMPVLLARPRRRPPVATVLVAHHRDGIDAFTVATCRTLAEAGFLAAAPDLFSRVDEPGLGPAEKKARLADREILGDLARAHALVNSPKPLRTGVLGHCMGGRIALLAAVHSPFCDAAVSFYGGGLFRSWGDDVTSPGAGITAVRCPVLAIGGRSDTNPSPDDLGRLALACVAADYPVEVAVAEGAGHAFMNFLRPEVFHPLDTQLAFARALAFLTRRLSRPGPHHYVPPTGEASS